VLKDNKRMFVVYTQAPKQRVEWIPPPEYSFIKRRGNTPTDQWYWTTATFEKALMLKNAIQHANRGKKIRLYIKNMARLPSGWN
jgi:hypothetical protein